MEERINNMNSALCGTPQIPYLGATPTGPCGFPNTSALIINNSKIGKKILNNTQVINGERLLTYQCDNTNGGTNIV
jgi:hypothetical protein